MSRRWIPWLLAAGSFDFALEQAIVSPALPAIQVQYGASPTTVVWLVTGFLLGATVATPVAGRLGDRLGRRRVLVLSLFAFAAGSLMCALGASIGALIAGRVVQGLGAGVGPLTLALACEGLEPHRVARVVGLLVGAAGLGAISALVGAVLVDHVSVSSIFWLLLGVALCLAVFIDRTVPETPQQANTLVDWPGAALLAAGLGGVMLVVSQGDAWGWGSPAMLSLEGGAAVLLVAFVVREMHTPSPLIDVATLRARPMWTADVAVFVVGFSFIVAYTLVPLIAGYPSATGYGLGLSTTNIALVLVPAAVASLIAGLLAGRLARLVGSRNLALAGTACALTTYVALITLHWTAATLAVAMVPLGLGLGLSLSAILDVIVMSSGAHETGVTIALNNVIRSIGSVLGPQVAIAVVLATPSLVPGLPAEAGFRNALVMGAIATGVAVLLLSLIPGPSADPVRQEVADAASWPWLSAAKR